MKKDVYDHHAAIYFLLQDKYNRAKLSLNREQLLNSSSGRQQQQQQQKQQEQQKLQHALQHHQQQQQRHTCRVPDTGVPESIAEESPTATTLEPTGPAQTASHIHAHPPPLPLQPPPPPPPAPLPERMPPPARPAPPTTLWETEEDSSPSSSDPPTDLLQQVNLSLY